MAHKKVKAKVTDAERECAPAQEVHRESDYIAPGLYRWMLDQPPISENTISSIDELQEYERREKEEHHHHYLEQRQRLKGFVPTADDLIQMHRHCKACPFHIQRCEMWKHPFRSALSIYRSWRHNRAFRRRMTDDMVNRDKTDSEHTEVTQGDDSGICGAAGNVGRHEGSI